MEASPGAGGPEVCGKCKRDEIVDQIRTSSNRRELRERRKAPFSLGAIHSRFAPVKINRETSSISFCSLKSIIKPSGMSSN
jgi:hypothetical protein